LNSSEDALQCASKVMEVSDIVTSKPLNDDFSGRAAKCLHCGSSELVKKGKSESVDKDGLTGRRVKCKGCGKGSTLWEPVD